MRKSVILAGAAALVVLTGCEKAEAPAPADTNMTDSAVGEAVPAQGTEAGDAAAAAHRHADWAGKWTGVEGMYVNIAVADPGRYKLDMQSDLDTKGSYDGEDGTDGIKFRRGEEELVLRRGSGDDTGLKYLADKTDCLVVKPGEGYCRD